MEFYKKGQSLFCTIVENSDFLELCELFLLEN